jgi:prephenate dehydratase
MQWLAAQKPTGKTSVTIVRMQIAIQGALGSFHNQAALQIDPRADILSKNTFAEVFLAVANGESEYGICAIENNLHGPINEVYRLLERYDMWIVRDVTIAIGQQLIAAGPVSLEELAASSDVRILSQAPALAQVELWLDKYLPNAAREETPDTAGSVRHVMELGEPHILAVAGTLAAEMYDGTIVAHDIQDDPHNQTRFILFQRDHTEIANATHTSIILKTDHTSGALLRALQVFADEECNLTKLDSHPIPGDKRHYAFYIDYEIAHSETSTKITRALERQGCSVKTLGEYFSA